MSLTLKNIYKIFFFAGIFFIPVNSYEGISFLGEYKQEGAIVFFLISYLFFIINTAFKRFINIPYKNIIFQVLVLFIVWIIISTLFNFPSVNQNYIKETSGINRFIRQFFSLTIVLFLFILAYNIYTDYTVKDIFFKLRRVFLYSFILVCIYGVIEILVVYYGIFSLKKVILLFNYFPFTNVYLDYTFKRISSFSLEPPFLAIYLMTIAGWMYSYIVTSKKSNLKKYIPTIFIFIITFYSGSRTALVVISIQFIVFLATLFSINNYYRKIVNRFLLASIVLLIAVFSIKSNDFSKAINEKVNSLNFVNNLLENTSNRTRFGIQYASIIVFTENPIFGVGFGQQAYKARPSYPKWATDNNYEFRLWYLNDKVKSFPPGYNIYTRLLAETGIIGFFIFSFLLGLLIFQSKKLISNSLGLEKIINVVLLVSFTGFIINWLQIDSFRIFGFWICLALIIKQIQDKKVENA